MKHLNYKNFKIGLLFSLISAVTILIFSFSYGKNNFFLLLNNDLGIFADYLFVTFTYLGDGLLWIPLVFYFIFSGRQKLLPFLISCFVLITIFTQGCKYLIVPDELRPLKALTGAIIHKVSGVTVNTTASFPSGHTATAFVFYLIFCLLIKNNWWVLVGFLYAIGVGYSRIYLAQHFPLDVGAGIIVAAVSVLLSIVIQNRLEKRGLKKLNASLS